MTTSYINIEERKRKKNLINYIIMQKKKKNVLISLYCDDYTIKYTFVNITYC